MALVAYDYSSESDNEDNSANETENTNIVKNNADEVENEKEPLEVDSNDPIPNKSDLFSALPQKKSTNDVEEAQIEDFVPKSSKVKEKQKVRITIPSLSQFADEEDEPQSKKLKPSLKTSGLISLLPPVKGAVTTAKSFVPNIVNKNMNSTPVQSPLVPNAVRKKAEAKKAALLQKMQKSKAKIALSDAESDDDIEMPESFDDEMWEKVCGRPKPKPQPVIQQSEELPPQEVIDIAPEPEKQYDGLDNKAFKELVGKSKRPIGNIKLIE
ncbi:hypothetical protein JTB14_001755 [Gonioctena quinquepunctata]|nr:hypothetical protein JTB14_001755 [Gonioctena quinquepunctata]